jgi:hypothetical protein
MSAFARRCITAGEQVVHSGYRPVAAIVCTNHGQSLKLADVNVDEILMTMNRLGCRFLLIGGMNFMLRHEPILTYDVDLWIEDREDNRCCCELALLELGAEWGATEDVWGPVSGLESGWLDRQHVFSLITPHGAIDIFRSVFGLDDWQACWQRATSETTASGVEYRGLSDEDMLQCQLALSEGEQKQDRIRALRDAIDKRQNPA